MSICKPHGMMNDDGTCPYCLIYELQADNKALREELNHYRQAITDGANEYITDALGGQGEPHKIMREWFTRTGWEPPKEQGNE